MKGSARILLLVLALTIGLPALAWTATFLYWHFRIRSAIRQVESADASSGGLSGDLGEAGRILQSAGCRCLPYVVGAMDESRSSNFTVTLLAMVTWYATAPTTVDEKSLVPKPVVIDSGDSAEVRGRKIQFIRAWWREHGTDHHQWWRVWSSDCSAAR
jgi:hypothetical protein